MNPFHLNASATVGASGSGTIRVGQSVTDSALLAMTGTLSVGPAGGVTLAGAGATVRASAITIAAGGSIEGSGTLSGDGGGNHTVMLANIVNDGTLGAAGGSLLVYGSVAGIGQLNAGNDTSLTLQAAIGRGQTVLFAHDSTVTLNDIGAFGGTIDGFGPGDTIAIGGLPYSASGTATLQADNVLEINEGNQAFRLQFDPPQDFSNNAFRLDRPRSRVGGTIHRR